MKRLYVLFTAKTILMRWCLRYFLRVLGVLRGLTPISSERELLFTRGGKVCGVVCRSSRGNKRASTSPGFTLIEVLISLVLIALIVSLLFGGFQLALRSSTAADAGIEKAADLRAASHFLRGLFQQIRASRSPGITGNPILFKGLPNRVVFVAPFSVQSFAGGTMLLELSVEEEDKIIVFTVGGETPLPPKRRLLLKRKMIAQDWKEIPSFTEDAESVELIQDVDALEIRYFGYNRDEASPEWTDRWENPNRLPQLISLQLLKKGQIWPPMVINLLIGDQRGCRWNDKGTLCQ